MNKFYTLLSFILLTAFESQPAFAQNGHNIQINIEGFADTVCYLANHYGNKQYIKDTISVAPGGKVVFEGEEPLPGGIYLVVLPPKNNYFEMIISDDQHFSMNTTIQNLVADMTVEGSDENQVFYEYLVKLGDIKTQSDDIDEEVKSIKGDKKKSELDKKNQQKIDGLNAQKKTLQEDVNDYRMNIMEQYPSFFYTAVLKAMKDPDIPEAPTDENGNPLDSLFDFKYYKQHFFDGVDFSDERLSHNNYQQGKHTPHPFP